MDEPNKGMVGKTVVQNGFVFLSRNRRKRDIGAAATNGDQCEFDLVRKRSDHGIRLRPWMPKTTKKEFAHTQLNRTLDPNLLE